MAKFDSEIILMAQRNEKEYGVPASVTLAQYALESTYGTSALAKKTNNVFSIKYYGSGSNYYMSNGVRWRKFNNVAEAFEAHGELLSGSLYAPKTANAKSINEYIDAIAETYAPSSDGNNNYAGQLKAIIADHNLTQYDQMFKDEWSTPSSADSLPENNEEYNIWDGEYWLGILGNIVKFVVMVGMVVLSFVLIMKAFDVSPGKTLKKIKPGKKQTEEGSTNIVDVEVETE